jgi:hypothetical protein
MRRRTPDLVAELEAMPLTLTTSSTNQTVKRGQNQELSVLDIRV